MQTIISSSKSEDYNELSTDLLTSTVVEECWMSDNNVIVYQKQSFGLTRCEEEMKGSSRFEREIIISVDKVSNKNVFM